MVHAFAELIQSENLTREEALMLAVQSFSSIAFEVQNNYHPERNGFVPRPPAPRMNRRNEETKVQDDDDLSD